MRNQIKFFSLANVLLVSIPLLLVNCSVDHSDANAAVIEEGSTAVQVNQEKARFYDISENEEANMALAKEYMAATLAADGDKMSSLVNDGFMGYGPSATDSTNIAGAIATWEATKNARSDQSMGLAAMTALTVNEGNLKGDWVHAWGVYTAVDKETQQSYRVPWHSAIFIENNKISKSWGFYDRLAPSLQFGQVKPVEK